MNLVLAIETSSSEGSVALTDGSTLLGLERFSNDASHTKELLPSIKRLLKNAKADFKSLSLVSVDIGPGSFTGIRIGVTCAKFISYFASIPLLGVASTDTIAAHYFAENKTEKRKLAVILDAYRGQVYCALYGHNGEREFLDLLKPETVKERTPTGSILCGYGIERYRKVLLDEDSIIAPERYNYPESFYVALLWFHKFQSNKTDEVESLQPLYLRASEAEERRNITIKPEDLRLE